MERLNAWKLGFLGLGNWDNGTLSGSTFSGVGCCWAAEHDGNDLALYVKPRVCDTFLLPTALDCIVDFMIWGTNPHWSVSFFAGIHDNVVLFQKAAFAGIEGVGSMCRSAYDEPWWRVWCWQVGIQPPEGEGHLIYMLLSRTSYTRWLTTMIIWSPPNWPQVVAITAEAKVKLTLPPADPEWLGTLRKWLDPPGRTLADIIFQDKVTFVLGLFNVM